MQPIHKIEENVIKEQEQEPVPVSISQKRALIAAKVEARHQSKGMNYSSDGSHGELSESNIFEGNLPQI